MGMPAVANTSNRLATTGASRGSAFAGTRSPVRVATMLARDGAVAGSIPLVRV